MNSLERFRLIMQHKEADCVPYRMRLHKDLEKRFNDIYCGGEHHCDFFEDDVRNVHLDGEFIYPES